VGISQKLVQVHLLVMSVFKNMKAAYKFKVSLTKGTLYR